MHRALRVVTFFRVVSPLPPLMLGTFVALGAAASLVALVDPERTPDALLPVIVLQVFAASSGFAGPARRGYYDLLLTGGERRVVIALAHWLMSIAPGIATWLLVAGAEAIGRGDYPRLAAADGSALAVGVVSSIGWSLTVGLPRFSGAIGWLVAVVAVTSLWPSPHVLANGATTLPFAPLPVLVNPALMLGRSLAAPDVAVVAPVGGAAIGGLVIAVLWIARTDFPLEAAQ